MFHTSSRFAAGRLLLILLGVSPLQAEESSRWAVGKQFQEQLSAPVDILWTNNPLREALKGLAQAKGVAVLLDRRIDPDRRQNVSLQGVPLRSALQTIAEKNQAAIATLGSVVYFGPPFAAERFQAATAALESAVRRLPPALREKYTSREACIWEDLAEPRELLLESARRQGLSFVNVEKVPHDLWAAADLPPLSLVDRLTLIAIQFDLRIQIVGDGTRLKLEPLPEDIAQSPGLPKQPAPSDTSPSKPHRLPADDTPPEQVRIDRLSVREKPLEAVLNQLAARLGLTLQIDRQAIAAAGISLDQRVSVEIKNATIDELFAKLLNPCGLTFHRRGKVIEIVPAK